MKPRSSFEKGQVSLQLDMIILIDSIKTTGVNNFWVSNYLTSLKGVLFRGIDIL